MAEITMENVEQVFKATVANEGQIAAINEIENSFVEQAKKIISHVPRCADRSAALRKLLEAKMTCVQAIAKGGLI